MTRGSARQALAVLVLVLLVPTATAAGEEQCTIKRSPDIPVTMRGLRPMVHAQINGKDALFVADSGSFFSFVTPDAVPQLKMKLDYYGYRNGISVGGVGGREQAQVAVARSFEILGYTFRDVDFVVADVGRGGYGGEGVGLLGQNVFRIADVEYDLANGVIRLVMPQGRCNDISLAYWAHQAGKPYSVIDIEFATPTSPHTRSVAYLNGAKIRVIFDTGAAGSTLTLAAAKRAGITPTSPGVTAGGEVGGIGYRTPKTWITHFASFKIGDEEIQHARLRFGDISPDADMLIGSDFFLSHRIYVASSQGKLYFTYNGGPVFDLTTRTPASAGADAAAPNSDEAKEPPPPSADTQRAPAGTTDGAPASPNAPAAAPNALAPTAGTAGAAAGAVAAVPATHDSIQADAVLDKPTDAAGFSRRAAASMARHNYPGALADLTRACELAPTEASYVYQRGMAYWGNKQADRALADFDKAIGLKPDDVDALIARATLRASHREPAEVVAADLEAADRALPKEAEAHMRIGDAYAEAGQQGAAVVQYSKWIDAHPHDERRMATALNSRCRARALLGQELDQALADCKAALRARPDSAEILDSRGLVYLRQNNYDKAIRDYDAALRLQPNNARSLYGRGLAKLRKGMSAQGQADIAAAVALEPKIAERAGRYGITQ